VVEELAVTSGNGNGVAVREKEDEFRMLATGKKG
jgi:hypothetical protein